MGRLQQLADLPAFLLGFAFLYWSIPLGLLQGQVQGWRLTGKRDDALGWARGIADLFLVRILQLPGPQLHRVDGTVYLANHRSWADFFLDVILTDSRAMMLSRMAVMAVFPTFMVCVWAIQGVVLFVRGGKVDKEKFNDMLDGKLRASPMKGLIVYPEGHRSLRRESLPLKRGMLHFCYDRQHPVQVVMTANKEALLSEKQLRCRLGQTILVGYSQPIDPTGFPSFDAFMAEVQRVWDAEWARVYGADWSTARPKPRQSLQQHAYSPALKAGQAASQAAVCLLFFVSLFWAWRGGAALLGLFGRRKGVAAALLAVWCAASIARALVPVRLPPPARAPRRA